MCRLWLCIKDLCGLAGLVIDGDDSSDEEQTLPHFVLREDPITSSSSSDVESELDYSSWEELSDSGSSRGIE